MDSINKKKRAGKRQTAKTTNMNTQPTQKQPKMMQKNQKIDPK
jgi:hypothetical protein